MPSIAIIGAGCSGLAAALTLRDAGFQVTLFEKSAHPGGRAATRQQQGFIFDHGAQYIKKGAPASVNLITQRFQSPDLLDISKPVWTFDAANHIQEGDPAQNAEPKWSYQQGLVTLAQLMAQSLDIHYNTRIARLKSTPQGWQLFTDSGQDFSYFTYVLVTLPAPQARELLDKSDFDSELKQGTSTHLAQATYNPLLSVALGYQPRPRSRPYYALVNTDKAHPISWLAWEHEKSPARVPDQAGLLIAQMAPQYSHDHWQTPDALLIKDVAQLVSTLIDEQLPTPIFSDVQHWRYALPTSKADSQLINQQALLANLAFCGDSFVGGRVHLALEHGIMVAQNIIDR